MLTAWNLLAAGGNGAGSGPWSWLGIDHDGCSNMLELKISISFDHSWFVRCCCGKDIYLLSRQVGFFNQLNDERPTFGGGDRIKFLVSIG